MPWSTDPIPADRVEALLATHRIAPSNRAWRERVAALQIAARRGPPELAARCEAESRAMFEERTEHERRKWIRARAFVARDEKAMLHCEMRHPVMRGLTQSDCRRVRRCFLCAARLPARRQHWCSDRCARLWTDNHEWRSAAWAAMRRDRGCVRDPEHKGPFECNHMKPRVGRGYHKGCHNHLRDLETLCHPCHVVETKAQGKRRRAGVQFDPPPLTYVHPEG